MSEYAAEMKETPRRLWIEALRSGDYDQGTGALRRHNRFCCLGVLCEVARINGLALEIHNNEGSYSYDRQSATLPRRVIEWAGSVSSLAASSRNPRLGAWSAATWNDELDATFEKIAELIEKHVRPVPDGAQ